MSNDFGNIRQSISDNQAFNTVFTPEASPLPLTSSETVVDVTPPSWPDGLMAEQVLTMYRLMVATRAYDERALKLQRSGRIGFCVTSFGEEACQIGTAMALQSTDWLFPSYRQVGVALARDIPLSVLANNLFGNQADISKGRQMPVHYTYMDKRFVSISSVIGTQISQAVGCAMASHVKGEADVTATYFGDGATSANDFHSGLTFAGVFQSPVLFICINNQYAISLPVAKQNGNPELWTKGQGYGIPSVRVDGNDVLAVYQATQEAAKRARTGGGPTLLELLTYRAGAHSSSDDPSRYRRTQESEHWQRRDPIALFKAKLIDWHLWSDAQDDALWMELREQMTLVTNQAEALPPPDWKTLFEDVYKAIPPALSAQQSDLLANEASLLLRNEGEFPL
jgi:pyruvate dehydrogenase E1 component alpha subunit